MSVGDRKELRAARSAITAHLRTDGAAASEVDRVLADCSPEELRQVVREIAILASVTIELAAEAVGAAKEDLLIAVMSTSARSAAPDSDAL